MRVVETDSGRECAEVESVRVTFEYRWDRYSISIWKSEDFTLYRGQMPLSLEERVGYDYRKNDNRTGIKMKVVQNVMRMSDSQYVPTASSHLTSARLSPNFTAARFNVPSFHLFATNF